MRNQAGHARTVNQPMEAAAWLYSLTPMVPVSCKRRESATVTGALLTLETFFKFKLNWSILKLAGLGGTLSSALIA